MTSALVVDLADAGADAGGKATGLAQLIAAGVPVPPGFVITGAGFSAVTHLTPTRTPALADVGNALAEWAAAAETAPLPDDLAQDVLERARQLDGPLAVRSSMAFEDRPGSAAPGLGLSLLGIAPENVWTAIRAVWVAAMTPLVAVYARSETLRPAGVIVQRELLGTRTVIYTRPPGRPGADELWIHSGDQPASRVARDEPLPDHLGHLATAVRWALEAERAIGADDGADVELVGGRDGWSVVQARPVVHPRRRPPRTAAPEFVLSGLRASSRVWKRDITHNPDPLSPAQAGLCDLVERSGIAPFHLTVVAGYLYGAPRADAARSSPPATEVGPFLGAFERHAAAVKKIVAATTYNLDDALASYLSAYQILTTEIAPLVTAARRRLVDTLMTGGATRREATARAAALAPRPPSSVAALLAAAAHDRISRAELLAQIGEVSMAWDVAVPTFAERPHLIDDALLRARARPVLPPIPAAPPELADVVELARAAADAAEQDDLLFARAQSMVRRALLAYADRAGIDRDDVCWLPLAEVIEDARAPSPTITPQRAAGSAAAGRTAAARAAMWSMPLTVPSSDAATQDVHSAWSGDGFGGRGTGPATVIRQLTDVARVPAGAVVIASAITPAMALILDGAVAMVCEHGSLLDHGPAMARELGIPCVVGCAGIADALIDGDCVTVDGDLGQVTKIAEG